MLSFLPDSNGGCFSWHGMGYWSRFPYRNRRQDHEIADTACLHFLITGFGIDGLGGAQRQRNGPRQWRRDCITNLRPNIDR